MVFLKSLLRLSRYSWDLNLTRFFQNQNKLKNFIYQAKVGKNSSECPLNN